MTDVKDRKLTKIFVRGSSRKEKIDTNNKFIIFLLHESELYSVSIMNEYETAGKETRLFNVCEFNSLHFSPINNNEFYFL